MGDTKNDLVKDLEIKPPSEMRDALIERAKRGAYHDFDSPLVAPKIQCVEDLKTAGYDDLVAKVINGDYDDERPTVAQEEELRASIGPKTYDVLLGKPPRSEN